MKSLSKIYMGIVFFFLYAPIAVLIIFSFNSSKSRTLWSGFTFDWYTQLFHNDIIIESVINTLIIAVVASVIATIMGTAAAVGISTFGKKARTLIVNVTYLPVMNPEIITGVSLMLLFTFAKLQMGLTTLIIAHITFNVPYVILSVMPKLRQMDYYIYEAALDLGCSPFQAFFKVVIPEIMPGIVTGLMMAFTFSLDDFVISYFVSGPTSQTLPITIYSMTRRKVSPEINALSTIIFFIVLTILILMNVKDSKTIKIKKSRERETL